jgi:hypothetical protein
MQSLSHQSPLLRLPAEIRNQIYEYVMCNQTIAINARPPRSVFSLPRTCRQIYHETELLFYSGNMFQTREDIVLKEWLAARSARQLAAIQSVQCLRNSLTFLCLFSLHCDVLSSTQKLLSAGSHRRRRVVQRNTMTFVG